MPPDIPHPFSTAESGSFARETLAVRIPSILRTTFAELGLPSQAPGLVPPAVRQSFRELELELTSGLLRGLRERAPDRHVWDSACAPHLGRSWLDLPWYFAEAFFYRRILEATGYFQRGPLGGVDPFARQKAHELAPEEGVRRAVAMLAALPEGRTERCRALMLGSLWGNRLDLSLNVARLLGSLVGDERSDLLVDDSHAVAEQLEARDSKPVTIVADNAGTELLMDLALGDFLLQAYSIPRLTIHVKAHPTFVSDATSADLADALAALSRSLEPRAGALADRLRRELERSRLIVEAHPFYNTSLFFPELPAELLRGFAQCGLVIFKGDANYRRLCSDAHWATETAFDHVVGFFPAPLVALRILKADVIVGLPTTAAKELSAEDPMWRVNGRRGLIQARVKAPNPAGGCWAGAG